MTKKYRVRTITFTASEPIAHAIDTPSQCASFVHDRIAKGPGFAKESFWVVGLNARCEPIVAEMVSLGTVSATLVHPREVFRAAIVEGAHSIVVAHNHPSGDISASSEDVMLTNRLRQAGSIIGIPLVDSIIINQEGDYFSIVPEHY